MSDEPANSTDEILSFIKRQRDELKLKMHLAGKDAQDEWEKLEAKWQDIESRAEPLSGAVKDAAGTAGDEAKKIAGAAMDVAARELKSGYEKFRGLLD
jgi:uncharacterized protein YjbJ (UPF0337 family)